MESNGSAHGTHSPLPTTPIRSTSSRPLAGSKGLSKSEPNALHALNSDDSSEEDYDALKLDADTILPGSKGAGAELQQDLKLDTQGTEPIETQMVLDGNRGSYELRPTSKGTTNGNGLPALNRRTSIHVVLEKTNRKGRYVLTAEEPEVRELLRKTVEAELSQADPKKRRKGFRDLVFTRQFTTFDRQNPLSASSPFYGFFTLFWLCMAMLLIRVAAHNWVEYSTLR